MIMDDNDGQMIFGDLEGLKLPDICLTGEEKPQKNLTQETCLDRGSNPGPLHDRHTCYHLSHRGELFGSCFCWFGVLGSFERYRVIQIIGMHTDGCRSRPSLAYSPVSGPSE